MLENQFRQIDPLFCQLLHPHIDLVMTRYRNTADCSGVNKVLKSLAFIPNFSGNHG